MGPTEQLPACPSQGMLPTSMMAELSPDRLNAAFEQSQRAGVDPAATFKKLMAYPGLMQKLQEPRIMKAFMDISANPDSLSKYKDDPEVVEVRGAAQRSAGVGWDGRKLHGIPRSLQ